MQVMTLASMVTLTPIPYLTFRWSPWYLLPGPYGQVHCTALGMWGPITRITFQHHTHSPPQPLAVSPAPQGWLEAQWPDHSVPEEAGCGRDPPGPPGPGLFPRAPL